MKTRVEITDKFHPYKGQIGYIDGYVVGPHTGIVKAVIVISTKITTAELSEVKAIKIN